MRARAISQARQTKLDAFALADQELQAVERCFSAAVLAALRGAPDTAARTRAALGAVEAVRAGLRAASEASESTGGRRPGPLD